MTEGDMIKELIKLATHLDQKGCAKEADYLDSIIRVTAGETSDDDPQLSDGEKIKILINGLLELREDVPSGSLEMAIIDETLGKVGEKPWLTPDHGRPRGPSNELNDEEAEELIRDYIRSDRSARYIEDAIPPIK